VIILKIILNEALFKIGGIKKGAAQHTL